MILLIELAHLRSCGGPIIYGSHSNLPRLIVLLPLYHIAIVTLVQTMLDRFLHELDAWRLLGQDLRAVHDVYAF